MENNMGTYRLVTRFWPEPREPEIIVTGGFPEFYFTAIDRLGSRTVFLYYEVLQLEMQLSITRFFNQLRESLQWVSSLIANTFWARYIWTVEVPAFDRFLISFGRVFSLGVDSLYLTLPRTPRLYLELFFEATTLSLPEIYEAFNP